MLLWCLLPHALSVLHHQNFGARFGLFYTLSPVPKSHLPHQSYLPKRDFLKWNFRFQEPFVSPSNNATSSHPIHVPGTQLVHSRLWKGWIATTVYLVSMLTWHTCILTGMLWRCWVSGGLEGGWRRYFWTEEHSDLRGADLWSLIDFEFGIHYLQTAWTYASYLTSWISISSPKIEDNTSTYLMERWWVLNR